MLTFIAIFLKIFPRAWHIMIGNDDKRNHSMDGARGLLSLWVLTHHLNVLTVIFQPNSNWEPGPGTVRSLMLSAFFVAPFYTLTGMLFGGGLLASRGHLATKRFVRNRFFRLAPAYIVSLIVVFAVAFYLTNFTLRVSWFKLITEIVRWSSFGFLNRYDINGVDVATWHGMLWTLPYEIAFYGSIPILAFLQRKTKSPAALIVGLGALGFVYWPFIFFTAGAVAAAGAGWRHPFATRIWFFSSMAAPILLAVTASHTNAVLQAMLLIPLIVGVALQFRTFSPLRWKPIRFVGEISYSIYLLHFPMISILYRLVVNPVWVNSLDTIYRTMLLALMGFAIIGISAASYVIVERPCSNFGRNSGRHVATMRKMIAGWLRRNSLRQ